VPVVARAKAGRVKTTVSDIARSTDNAKLKATLVAAPAAVGVSTTFVEARVGSAMELLPIMETAAMSVADARVIASVLVDRLLV